MHKSRINNCFHVLTLIIVTVFIFQINICLSAEKIEGRVNINSATEDQIAFLPGIGPKLAKEVVSYRTTSGGFKTIEDIKRVSGVGEKKFEKIKDFIVVEGDTTINPAKTAKDAKKTQQ